MRVRKFRIVCNYDGDYEIQELFMSGVWVKNGHAYTNLEAANRVLDEEVSRIRYVPNVVKEVSVECSANDTDRREPMREEEV